jgi:hypothetical protein
MKRKLIVVLLLLFLIPGAKAQDPITKIIQEGIKEVIRAIDLKIQRLQNETIWLQDVQKTVENVMAKLKLDEISDWAERQRSLYANYFDELRELKQAFTYYSKLKNIIELQTALIRDYKRAIKAVKETNAFTPEELLHILNIYEGIAKESSKNIESLFAIISSFATQMTDAKRMELINESEAALKTTYDDLKRFSSQNLQLSISRARSEKEIQLVKALYGIKN